MNRSTDRVRRIWAALAISASAALAIGCGSKSESELLAEAKAARQRGDVAASLVPLRSALAVNPNAAEIRFLLGQALLDSQQPASAWIELQKALDLGHDPNAVLPVLAGSLLAAGEMAKVKALPTAGLTEPAAKANVQAAQASVLLMQGDLAGGRAAVDSALKLDPGQASAAMLQARLMAGEGHPDDALRRLDELLAAQPKLAAAHALRGDLLWAHRGDEAAARAALQRALELDPKLLSAHTSLLGIDLRQKNAKLFKAQLAELQKAYPRHAETQFYTAQADLMDGNPAKARETLQRLLLATPDNPYVLQLAGAVEFETGALSTAEARLSKALNLAPSLATARILLAETYLRQAEPAKALQVLQPMLAAAQPPADALALAGQAHLIARNPQQASALFAAAAKADPGNQRIRASLGLAEIAQGRRDAGFALLEEAARTDGGSYADLALYGARLQTGDAAGALRAAQGLEVKQKDQPLPYMLQGQVLMQMKKPQEARARFEKVLAVTPTHAPAVLALTAMDQQDGKLAAAEQRLNTFLKLSPNQLQAMLGLAELQLQQGKKADDVLALLVEAARKHPTEIAPRVVQLNLLLRLLRNDAALSTAQATVADFPQHPEALGGLARAQLAAGSPQQALSTLRKLVGIAPGAPGVQVQLGNAYVAANNLRLAEQSFKRATELDPGSREAAAGLVHVALLDKRPDDALKAARSLQRARPAEAVGLVMEGEIHLARRAYGPAVDAFRGALGRQDTAEVAKWVYTAEVRAGRPDQAERFGERRLQTQPSDAEFLHFMATEAIKRKDWAAAEKRLRDLQTLLPENPAAPNNLAWVLLQQNKPGALALAQRANQLLPGNAGMLDTLAMAQAAEKQWADAVATQRKVVELAPAEPELQLRLAKYLIGAGDRPGARQLLEPLASQAGAEQAQARALLTGL